MEFVVVHTILGVVPNIVGFVPFTLSKDCTHHYGACNQYIVMYIQHYRVGPQHNVG
jgi:hypothetical protein